MGRRTKGKKALTERRPPVSELITRRLAAAAVEKTRQGERPTREERRALRRLQRERDEADRWRHYRAVPKGDWVQMSGRHYRQLDDQADRYGIPLRGRTIDLTVVVPRIHDFIERLELYQDRLLRGEETDPLLLGSSSPALEQYRRARTELARLELGRQRGELLSKVDLEAGFRPLTRILREAVVTLQQEYGDEAAAVVTDAMDRWLSQARQNLSTDEAQPRPRKKKKDRRRRSRRSGTAEQAPGEKANEPF